MTLEAKFHQAMVQAYSQAKRDCGYNATRFLQMVASQGGVSTAKSLLNSGHASSGFAELWEHGRLDLTVEAHVILPEYRALFTDAERQIAVRRLLDHGFPVERLPVSG